MLSNCFIGIGDANALKIVATVGSEAITDYDIEMFAKLMCNVANKRDKNAKCKEEQIINEVVMMVVESKLKGFYIERMKIDISEDKEMQKHIESTMLEYGVEKSKVDHNDYEEIRKYVETDYVWNAILVSFINSQKITDGEIEAYRKKNPSIRTNEEAKQVIGIERATQKASEIMTNLRKFYLVEFRI
ncbi:MAG: hypothetical protein RL208_356 [Pseudomonadota bacterium]|jgi:hypothetical protein